MDLEQIFVDLAATYPWLFMVFTFIAVFRLIFKPVISLADAYVMATPDKSDDEKWAKIKASRAYVCLAWVVDYLMSVKLPTKKKEEPLPVGEANELPKAS